MITYNDTNGMWEASFVDKFGRTHRKFFHTRQAAQHWLDHRTQ